MGLLELATFHLHLVIQSSFFSGQWECFKLIFDQGLDKRFMSISTILNYGISGEKSFGDHDTIFESVGCHG